MPWEWMKIHIDPSRREPSHQHAFIFSESHCRDSNLHYTQKRTNNHKVGDKSNSQSPDISEDDNYEIAERTLTTNDTTVTTELIISKTAWQLENTISIWSTNRLEAPTGSVRCTTLLWYGSVVQRTLPVGASCRGPRHEFRQEHPFRWSTTVLESPFVFRKYQNPFFFCFPDNNCNTMFFVLE